MKVIGKYMLESPGECRIGVGGYSVFEVHSIRTVFGKDNPLLYDYSSASEIHDCFVKIVSGFQQYTIKNKDGSGYTLELANRLTKDIALNDLVELDQYDMGLFDIESIPIEVTNSSFYGEEPLIVKIVDSEDEYE